MVSMTLAETRFDRSQIFSNGNGAIKLARTRMLMVDLAGLAGGTPTFAASRHEEDSL